MQNDDFCSNIDVFANTIIEGLGANPREIDWESFDSIINRRSDQLFCAAGYAKSDYATWRDDFYANLAEMILDLRPLVEKQNLVRLFDLAWQLLEQAHMQATTSRGAAASLFIAALQTGEAPVLRQHLRETWNCARQREEIAAG